MDSSHSSTSSMGSQDIEDRLDFVFSMVNKRVKDLDYLRRMHSEDSYWLNSVMITDADMRAFYEKNENLVVKRAEQWFYFGLSASPLLLVESSFAYIRGLAQLVEEYEYFFANIAVQGMKRLLAWTSSSGSTPDEIRPTIHKSGGQVVYEFLRTPNLPFDLDPSCVVATLCETLQSVYFRFAEIQELTNVLYDTVLHLDARFKHHFFGLLSRDVTTIASAKLKAQLSSLDMVYALADFHSPLSASLSIESAPYSERRIVEQPINSSARLFASSLQDSTRLSPSSSSSSFDGLIRSNIDDHDPNYDEDDL